MNNDSFKDYYKILQVDRNAAEEVITVAYKSLAKKYHPDLNFNNLDEANEKMKAINEAYSILNNDESRRKYNLIYDSYNKNNISNSSINNTHNSYMTRKSRKEAVKKENIKRNSFLNFKKGNTVIASVIAILFIFIIAEKVLISSNYVSADKIQKNTNTNIKQTDKMRSDFDNNHLNNPDNNSRKPDRKASFDQNR